MILDGGKFKRFKDFIFRPEDVDGVVGEKDSESDVFFTVVYFKGHGHSFKDNEREYLDYFDSLLINRHSADNQVELSVKNSEKNNESKIK